MTEISLPYLLAGAHMYSAELPSKQGPITRAYMSGSGAGFWYYGTSYDSHKIVGDGFYYYAGYFRQSYPVGAQ